MSGRRGRQVVTSPQTRLAMARRPDVPHLAPGALRRAREQHSRQLRQAIRTLGLLAAIVGGLPVLLAALPGLDAVRWFGIPVSWLAVGVLPYVGLVTLAAWHLRRAERAEREP